MNILLPNFVAFLVLPGTATSFIEKKFFFRNVNVTGRHLVLLGGEYAGYPEIEEPIRLRKKYYPPVRYMLNIYMYITLHCMVLYCSAVLSSAVIARLNFAWRRMETQ